MKIIEKNKVWYALIQIGLLVSLIFAQSYLLNFNENKNESFAKIFEFIKDFLSIKEIGTVSAAGLVSEVFCCPETYNGEKCKTMDNSDIFSCKYALSFGACDAINCFRCCPETEDGEYCENYNLYDKDDCARTLLAGSCEQLNCRVVNDLGERESSVEVDASFYCCPETEDGAICQDILSSSNESCDNLIQTSCSNTAQCKLGCCYEIEEGLCSTRASKQKCESDGGEWYNDETCSIQQCVKGCCVLGNEAKFITEQSCVKLSAEKSFDLDFRDIENELECLGTITSQERGACVYESGACKITTKENCLSEGRNFYKDYLCSHPDLNNSCERQASINCENTLGYPEIYWYDSCGNRENIYSSNKDESWNEGKILAKQNSCNPSSSNINSNSCGNCDGYQSICDTSENSGGAKVLDGDFICKDLTCVDENGKERKNGESWCVYDGYIGEGKDTVGSRHWLRKCVDGEIVSEGCADYRGEICVQSEIEGNEGEDFSMAYCVINDATSCLNYNSKPNKISLCNENENCILKSVDVSDHFKFDVCVGKYPLGSDLSSTSATTSSICSIASNKCEVYYKKDWTGNWDCIANCGCKSGSFASQMNDLCISLGDCGSYVNYEGKGTNNGITTGTSGVSWTEYVGYSKIVKGQYASPKSLEELSSSGVGLATPYNPEEGGSGLENSIDLLGKISGGLGLVLQGVGYLYPGLLANSLGSAATSTAVVATPLGAFAGAAIAAGIGMAAGSLVANMFNIKGDGAAIITLAGGVIGAAAFLMQQGIISTLAGGYTIGIAVVIILYIIILGVGDTKTEVVYFDCLPWQAPTGGDDCYKCNEDLLKPCTKYKCDSLGQSCQLINEDLVENPICESIVYETNAPKINTGNNVTEDYQFQNEGNMYIEIRKINGDCVQEFTPIIFELETDEYAQCKYSFERSINYEDMIGGYPLEQTLFTKEHNFFFEMPSIDSLRIYNVEGDLKKKFGETDIYIRCIDSHGNFNLEEYTVNFCINSGPDETPVSHIYTSTIPNNNAKAKYGATEVNFTMWINEPAECKYNLESDVDYDNMSYSLDCKTDLTEQELKGWRCNAELELEGYENEFYIKCKDQPWLKGTENESKRNANSEDYIYTLYLSEEDLAIENIRFEFEGNAIESGGELVNGFEPIPINMIVRTDGGSDFGVAECSWGISENSLTLFYETGTNIHTQLLTSRFSGNYKYYIECVDPAGNVANDEGNFTLSIDTLPPEVVRIYKNGNDIKLITNEKAECYYDLKKCHFNFDNATSITTAFSTEHTIRNVELQNYYVRCKDVFQNSNPDCAIIVKPNHY